MPMALTKYDYYYTLTNFNVLNVDNLTDPLVTNQIDSRYLLMGIRFQRLLLDNGDLYRALGFYREEDISSFIGNVRPIPSRLIFSDQSDAMRMNVVRRIDFDLIPQDDKVVSAAFGTSKGSFVHYPTTMNTNEAAGVLLDKVFDFRMDGATSPIDYVVDPRSIRDHRSRRTSPQFTSIAAIIPSKGTTPPPPGGGGPGSKSD